MSRTTSLRLPLLILLFVLVMLFLLTLNNPEAAYSQASPTGSLVLRNSGVDGSGNKRSDGNCAPDRQNVDNQDCPMDPGWNITRIYSDRGWTASQHCQYMSAAGITASPRYANLVNEYGTRAGLQLQPFTPPATSSQGVWRKVVSQARWISINHYGWHDGFGTPKTTPAQEPPGACYDPSNEALFPSNFTDYRNWHTYVFRPSATFNLPQLNDPTVDQTSYRFEITGGADNHVMMRTTKSGAANNGALHVQCAGDAVNSHVTAATFSSGTIAFDTSRWGQGDPNGPGTRYMHMCTSLADRNRNGDNGDDIRNFTSFIPPGFTGSDYFNSTNNNLEIHIKSAWGHVGLLVQSIRLTWDYLPDVCDNIAGIQPTIPPGLYNQGGNCISAATCSVPTSIINRLPGQVFSRNVTSRNNNNVDVRARVYYRTSNDGGASWSGFTATDPPTGGLATITANGGTETFTINTSFASVGTYIVEARVWTRNNDTFNSNLVTTCQFTVEVSANISCTSDPPAISGWRGELINFAADVTNPSNLTIEGHHRINGGSYTPYGPVTANRFTGSHTFNSAGSHTIEIHVRGAVGGGYTSATCQVAVTIYEIPTCRVKFKDASNTILGSIQAGTYFQTIAEVTSTWPGRRGTVNRNATTYTHNIPPAVLEGRASGTGDSYVSTTTSSLDPSVPSSAEMVTAFQRTYLGGNSANGLSSGSTRINAPGTYANATTWTIDWWDGSVNRTITCRGTPEVYVVPIDCVVSNPGHLANIPFAVQVTLLNSNYIPITVTGSSWTVPASTLDTSGFGVRDSTDPSGASVNDATGGGTVLPERSSLPGITIYSDDVVRLDTSGDFAVSWTVTTNYADANPGICNETAIALERPYIRAFGNDVIAGGGFGSYATSIAASAKGYGGYDGSIDQAGFFGSASELAIMAVEVIEGVMPGSQFTRSPVAALAFANTSASVGTQDFGGGFAGPLSAPNFLVDNGGTNIASASIDISGMTGSHRRSGNLTINNASPVAGANRPYIYVDGNLTITSNITYGTTTWATIDAIPLVRIVATGNIYIDKNVTNLEGLYVAGGDIFTCTNGTSPYDFATANAAIVTNCRNPLTVTGALLASNVHLWRVNGSINPAVKAPSETSLGASTNIAEKFVFSQEMYLALLSVGGENDAASSLLSLPPAF